jgi:hypothetical protein
MMRRAVLLLLALPAFSPAAALAAETAIAVSRPAGAPMVDGNLAEWGKEGWRKVKLNPAVENDPKNKTGKIEAELKFAVHGDRLFTAARWPDPKADTSWHSWTWDGSRYKGGRDEDDKFALRIELGGTFDACMLSDKNYEVDVWLWSAGRSNLGGMAENYLHRISTSMIEDAAEHKGPNGVTVYIKKLSDGPKGYARQKAPTALAKEVEPSSAQAQPPGKPDDILAKGVWKDGFWSLELSRKLVTGIEGRASLGPGAKPRAQIAVFNAGEDEHKSVSEPFLIDIGK